MEQKQKKELAQALENRYSEVNALIASVKPEELPDIVTKSVSQMQSLSTKIEEAKQRRRTQKIEQIKRLIALRVLEKRKQPLRESKMLLEILWMRKRQW